MPGESSSETENPYGRMHVTEPVRATIPVQNGARLSWDPWIHGIQTSSQKEEVITNVFLHGASLNIFAAFPYYTWRTSEGCRPGWIFHRGSCYFFLATRASYQDARRSCIHLGGYLAEVQSADENRFVAGMLPSYVKLNLWIGYNDLEKEGRWLWTNTGNSGTYTNWTSGEPNNKNDQDCAVIETYHGRTTWDDQDCGRHEPSVCEAGLFA